MPTPKLELEHLVDVLIAQVKKLGTTGAFQMGTYMQMTKSQAVHGGGLVAMDDLITKLMAVNDSLLFNYKDLKAAYSQVCKTYPAVKDSFSVEMRPTLSGKLAEATMTLCTHVRRLRIEQKFQEACRNLSDWQTLASAWQNFGFSFGNWVC